MLRIDCVVAFFGWCPVGSCVVCVLVCGVCQLACPQCKYCSCYLALFRSVTLCYVLFRSVTPANGFVAILPVDGWVAMGYVTSG